MAKFIFNETEWNNPNSFDITFKKLPESRGVYLLVHTYITDKPRLRNHEILYVGSSTNLKERLRGHQTLRFLKTQYEYVHCFFKECDSYYEYEKKIIKEVKPKYNIQHNG